MHATRDANYAAREAAFEAWEASIDVLPLAESMKLMNVALETFGKHPGTGFYGYVRSAFGGGFAAEESKAAGYIRSGVRAGINFVAHQALDGMQWARANLQYTLSTRESKLPEVVTPEEACKKYGGDACK